MACCEYNLPPSHHQVNSKREKISRKADEGRLTGEYYASAATSYPEAVKKGARNKKKQEVLHFLSPVDVPDAKSPVEANITVIRFAGETKEKGSKDVLFYEFGITPIT